LRKTKEVAGDRTRKKKEGGGDTTARGGSVVKEWGFGRVAGDDGTWTRKLWCRKGDGAG